MKKIIFLLLIATGLFAQFPGYGSGAYLKSTYSGAISVQWGSLTLQDNFWIGLGASSGRIQFINSATDQIKFLDADVVVSQGVDDKRATLMIVGDADSDAGGDTADTLRVTLVPNATPTSAYWDFTGKQTGRFRLTSPAATNVYFSLSSPSGYSAFFYMGYNQLGQIRYNSGISNGMEFWTAGVLSSEITASGSFSTVADPATLGLAATTFAITSNTMTITGNGGGNTVATITGARSGTLLTLIFVDGLVTITDTDAHTANTVDLSAAFTSADDTVLQLVFDGTSWYEISRSTN